MNFDKLTIDSYRVVDGKLLIDSENVYISFDDTTIDSPETINCIHNNYKRNRKVLIV